MRPFWMELLDSLDKAKVPYQQFTSPGSYTVDKWAEEYPDTDRVIEVRDTKSTYSHSIWLFDINGSLITVRHFN